MAGSNNQFVGNNKLLSKRFSEFKNITNEETRIINLINENIEVTESTKILDIGSNKGVISQAIQSKAENITFIDVEDFDIQSGARFLKGKWEDVEVKEKFDIIIASHVWGHFHHDQTTQQAFSKALSSVKEGGKVLLCYNTNDDVVGELIDLCKKLFFDFQYDIFDESLLSNLNIKEIDFTVSLKANDFDELVDLVQVLMIAPDEMYEFKKEEIKKYLKNKLANPIFDIHQKLVIIKR